MLTRTVTNLPFEGYYTTQASVPAMSGVYTVYACSHDSQKSYVNIRQLLYVGESGDVRRRIAEHLAGPNGLRWRRMLSPGEILCYSAAPAREGVRQIAEATIIYRTKPPTNKEYVGYFPKQWTPVVVNSTGARWGIPARIELS